MTAKNAVHGYDLRFRAPFNPASPGMPESTAALALADGILSIGLDTLTHGRPAFVTIPHETLLEGVPTLLPPQQVIIQIGQDSITDPAAVAACTALAAAGYKLAVDDIASIEGAEPIIRLADYIKVDCRAMNDVKSRASVLRRSAPARAHLVALHIETPDQFEQAQMDGFTYFQGFYFGQAVMHPTRELAARQMACLQLLQALNDPDLSIGELEDIIKRDPMLTYRLLRAVSSAGTALASNAPAVRSVQLALMLLGRDTVRRWASLWTVAALADGGRGTQRELVTMSIVRARCCELLDQSGSGSGFLLGMCSLLDAILGQPLETLVTLLPLDEETRLALCGEPNRQRTLLDCVIAYERGDWETCERLALEAGVVADALPGAYREALEWSRGLDGSAA